MKQIVLFIFSIVLLVACSVDEQEVLVENLPVVDGQNVKAMAIANLSKLKIRQPRGLVKNGDVCYVADEMNANNLYQIDLKTLKQVGLYPRVRTRRGEATILRSLASDGRGGYSSLNVETGEMLRRGSVVTRSEENSPIQLPKGQKHLWATQAGEYILSTGIYEEGRYLLYKPETGEAHYYLEYPEHPLYPDMKVRTKAVLFASNVLKARPDGGAFVCADMYSGIMEICRIEVGGISLVRRLEYHYPRIASIRKRGEWPMIAYSKENRFGFTDVCVTDDCIYALYSGRTFKADQKKFQYCRTLIEIGWDGEVRNTYPIDADLTYIAYDSQEKALYGIAREPKPTLVRLELPESADSNDINE